jgi:hypothetical protein
VLRPSAISSAAAGTLRLIADSSERPLPSRWLGYNSPAPYNVPVEDPALQSALVALRPHYLRFPGGTVSNYYQWRTGQLVLGDHPDNPIYREYALRSRALHPRGVFIAQYFELARAIDAELLVVPNLETSSADEQAEWFAQMNADGFVPARIEMGNEFFLALMMNPVTLARFPDWATTMRLMREYADRIRPHVARDARIAVQAAGSVFHNPAGDHPNPYAVDRQIGLRIAARERQWDDDMRPEPWFDAVTVHLYPTLEGSAGPDALPVGAANVARTYAAVLARVDEGYGRVLSDVVARMPGKEVWVTEWGAYEPRALAHGAPVSFDGTWFHATVRAILTMLRHPQVTVATNHSIFCDGNLMSAFRSAAGGYVPINASGAIAWFCAASRGPDAHHRRVVVDGARRVVAAGTIAGESFADVEACLMRRGVEHTLFVHNAGQESQRIDLSRVSPSDATLTGQEIATPDLLASLQEAAPEPVTLAPRRGTVEVSGYSLARITWSS